MKSSFSHFHFRAVEGLMSPTPRRFGDASIEIYEPEAAWLITQIDISFEDLASRLKRLPELYFEPDGSFVWVSRSRGQWQVDGMIYDRQNRVEYIDWKGCCNTEAWDRFLECLPSSQMNAGLCPTRIVVHAVQENVWIDCRSMRTRFREFN